MKNFTNNKSKSLNFNHPVPLLRELLKIRIQGIKSLNFKSLNLKSLNLFLLFCFASASLSAQVTIGKNEEPKPYAVLELFSQYESGKYGGLRLPQLTTAQRDALPLTADAECRGLQIYNLTNDCVETWNGVRWTSYCDTFTGAGNAPGEIWVKGKLLKFMTYNLGAASNLTFKQQMAMSGANTADMTVYGGFYQWGRKDDVHTFRGPAANPITSDGRFTTVLVANTGAPNATAISDHGKFVYGMSSPYSWTTPYQTNSDLWGNGLNIASGGNNPKKGLNDPCPAGWRVPTQHEWALLGNEGGNINNQGGDYFSTSDTSCYDCATYANSGLAWVKVSGGKRTDSFYSTQMCGYALYERSVWQTAEVNGTSYNLCDPSAPEPLLFLPAAGFRNYSGTATVSGVNLWGEYWSSTWGTMPFYISFSSTEVDATKQRSLAYGHSVRCIAE